MEAKTMDNRIKLAVELASDAFWDSVVRSFPEAETGDFDPLESPAINGAMTRAVEEWVHWNVVVPTWHHTKTLSAPELPIKNDL
jgi:hypothetical protein